MKKLFVVLLLGFMSFLPENIDLTNVPILSGDYNNQYVIGVVVNGGSRTLRRFSATDLMNLTYSNGNLDITRITNLQAALNNKQSLLTSGSNIKTINGISLLGSGNVSISNGSGVDTSNDMQKMMLKKFTQDNAPVVDYAVDDLGFDRVDGMLYVKGMHYFPSVATAYGTATLDPKSSNAAGKITFVSNGTAIPADGTVFTLTYVTTTYSLAPFVTVGSLESASAGQSIYPSEVSVNSFKMKIKSGMAPSNGFTYYYTYSSKPASNVSGQ